MTHALDILRRELDLAMGLCGLPDIASIGPDVLARPARAVRELAEVAARPAPGNGADDLPVDGAEEAIQPVPETGGPAGPEPTRYGDWERMGRAIDF